MQPYIWRATKSYSANEIFKLLQHCAMRLLLKYLGQYKGLLLLALLLAGTSQTFSFLNPYILGSYLIDPFAAKAAYFRQNGLEKDFLRGIGIGMLLLIATGVVGWVTRSYQWYVVNLITRKLGASIYLDVQQHTLRLSYKDFEDIRSGEILSILQKVRLDCESFITKFINVLFTSVIGLGVVIAIAFAISPWLPLVYIIGACMMVIMTQLLSKKVKKIQNDIVNESSSLAGSTTESLQNIELIKSLGLVQQESKRLNDSIFNILANEIKKAKEMRVITLMNGGFIKVLHHSIIFCLMMLIFYDSMTLGQLLMMQIYFYFVFGSLEELSGVLAAYQEADASLFNLKKILNMPVEDYPVNPAVIESLEYIRLEDVSFQHQSSTKPALQNISFEVRRGETIAIVGPSGSGKTTLVKLLVGLYPPTEGTLYYNDLNAIKVDFNGLRKQISLVSQDTQLFSDTIKENLLFVNSAATDAMIMHALNQAACQNLLARTHDGIETKIGEGGLKLSGGERQRLSIARALLRPSRLLIFDEATSSLDSLTEKGISDTIREIGDRHQYITVIVAHRLATVMHADRIHVLEHGKIIESGDHDCLLEQKGLYYAMWRQQVGEMEKNEMANFTH